MLLVPKMLSNRLSLPPLPYKKTGLNTTTLPDFKPKNSKEGKTGDTFSLLNDASRLQKSIERTISNFKLSKTICRELSLQLEICQDFLADLIGRYDRDRLALESQTYFTAFMEYTEVLSKASEFVLVLKDKGPLTRLKNREKYRKATRVLALEVGKAVQQLQALLSLKKSARVDSSDTSVHTMTTITGTLKLLRAQVFNDEDSCAESISSDASENTRCHLLQRRKIQRLLDYPPRLGPGCIIYKAIYEGLIVAEKVYSDINSKFLKDIQQEVSHWMKLRSFHNVAYIHGLWVEASSVGIVSDYYETSNLNQLLSQLSSDKVQIQRDVQMKMSLDLVEVIVSLHEQELAFGGIHPRAIFVNKKGALELGSVESLPHRIMGDFPDEYIPYAAPQVLQNRFAPSAPTLACDIYSVGVILGSIWSTSLPYATRVKRDFIIKGGRPDWVNQLPPQLTPIITQCLEFNASSRPTATHLLAQLQKIFSGQEFINEESPGLISDASIVSTHGSEVSYSSDLLSYSLPSIKIDDDDFNYQSEVLKTFSHINSPWKSPPSSLSRSLTLKSTDKPPTLEKALAFHSLEDYEPAYHCFLHLSEKESNSAANYYLGLYYYYGKSPFLPQDVQRAVYYLTQAAEHNHGDALDLLGVYYLDPEQGDDIELAYEHFQRAASALSPAGCYHLAQCHQNGYGTLPDPNLAFYALQLSASLGYTPAAEMLDMDRSRLRHSLIDDDEGEANLKYHHRSAGSEPFLSPTYKNNACIN